MLLPSQLVNREVVLVTKSEHTNDLNGLSSALSLWLGTKESIRHVGVIRAVGVRSLLRRRGTYPSLERAAVARLPRNKAENAHCMRLTFHQSQFSWGLADDGLNRTKVRRRCAKSSCEVDAGCLRRRGNAGMHRLPDQLVLELLRFADESGDIWGTYLTANTH